MEATINRISDILTFFIFWSVSISLPFQSFSLLHTHTQIVQKYCADRHTQVVSIPGSFVDPHHVDVDPAQPVQIGVDTNLLIYY